MILLLLMKMLLFTMKMKEEDNKEFSTQHYQQSLYLQDVQYQPQYYVQYHQQYVNNCMSIQVMIRWYYTSCQSVSRTATENL
jgi:transcription termination factor NusB